MPIDNDFVKNLNAKKVLIIVGIVALLLSLNEIFGKNIFPEKDGGVNPKITNNSPTPTTGRFFTSNNLTPTIEITRPPVQPYKAPTPSGPEPSLKEILGEKVISKLPYEGNGFEIEYFPKTNVLNIQVLEGKFSEKQKEAYTWLSENGVRDPESLNIMWSKNSNFVTE